MFETLATCYLFFGGVGAGALFVACLADLRFVREPFGQAAQCSSLESADPLRRALCFSFVTGFALAAFGSLCLLLDLGRPDRVVSLFLDPRFTYMSVGAFALVALLLLGGFLGAVRVFFAPCVTRRLVSAAETACAVISAVVMGYTGLLLSGMGTVALWDTPLVPALFALSSLSAGCAVVMCCSFAAAPKPTALARAFVLRLSRYDMVVIALEAVCAAAFAAWAMGSHRAAASAERLLAANGLTAALWWVVFVGFGLVAPLALEAAARVRGVRHGWAVEACAACAVAGVLVLVGAFGLRTSLVEAGQHRPLELMPPDAAMGRQADEAEFEGASAGIMAGTRDVGTKKAEGAHG